MLNNIKETLHKLGLKNNEIEVYITCFNDKHGMFVSEITKKTEIKRSSVNLILQRLIKRGFITYYMEGGRKVFVAETPETIIFNFENFLDDFKNLIPLLKVTGDNGKDTKVKFFEGKEGIEKIFSDILLTMSMAKNKDKEILAISSGKDIFEILPSHQQQFIDKRVKERISLRWLAPQGTTSQRFKEEEEEKLREIKYFDDKNYSFHNEIDVYGHKIALISLTGDCSGIIIENNALSRSFTSLFSIIWDSIK